VSAPALFPAHGQKVNFCEVILRDGLQSWPDFIETGDKIRILRAILDAGVTEIDAASFVSPKLVPQFADRIALLEAIPDHVRIRVLTVNAKGADAVIDTHRNVRPLQMCGIPFSVSEPHNLANLRATHAQHREAVGRMIQDLLAAGVRPLIGVVTAFGCPIKGKVEPEETLALAQWVYDQGVRDIMFGDTTGMANPLAVAEIFSAASRMGDVNLIAHFHDNRGVAIANVYAALGAGATTVDACLGGIGGEPKAIKLGLAGDQGNVASEDLLTSLAAAGLETGVNPDRLVVAGAIVEEIIGRPLLSKTQRTSHSKAIEEV
jgi:hydroxymethylglutaryl-CoA lyase